MTTSVHIPTPPKGWEPYAACQGEDGELFFPANYDTPDGRFQVAAARAVCARCPVMRACLLAALQREGGKHADARHGIWGGATPSQRYYLIHRQRPNQKAKAAA